MFERKVRAGKFICVDGPNGAGKSTVVDKVLYLLRCAGIDTVRTQEPSTSNLGELIRDQQDTIRGKALACLVAADRYDHIERTISPGLCSGKIVISDRYFPSSLVYQLMDGVEPDFVWSINKYVVLPDLFVLVMARAETLAKRLTGRGKRTRFEDLERLNIEISLYRKAFNTLESQGLSVLEVRNDGVPAEESARIVYESVVQLLGGRKGAAW